MAIYPPNSLSFLLISFQPSSTVFPPSHLSTSTHPSSIFFFFVHQAILFINSSLHALQIQQSTPHSTRTCSTSVSRHFFLANIPSFFTSPTRPNHHRISLHVHSQYSLLFFSSSPSILTLLKASTRKSYSLILIILIILILANI